MKNKKLVLSNGYVAYPKSVDHILAITEIQCGKGVFSFMIRWDPTYNIDGIKHFLFKSKRSCSYNRNKLLKWIDGFKRKEIEDVEDIERIERESTGGLNGN